MRSRRTSRRLKRRARSAPRSESRFVEVLVLTTTGGERVLTPAPLRFALTSDSNTHSPCGNRLHWCAEWGSESWARLWCFSWEAAAPRRRSAHFPDRGSETSSRGARTSRGGRSWTSVGLAGQRRARGCRERDTTGDGDDDVRESAGLGAASRAGSRQRRSRAGWSSAKGTRRESRRRPGSIRRGMPFEVHEGRDIRAHYPVQTRVRGAEQAMSRPPGSFGRNGSRWRPRRRKKRWRSPASSRPRRRLSWIGWEIPRTAADGANGFVPRSRSPGGMESPPWSWTSMLSWQSSGRGESPRAGWMWSSATTG